MDIESKIKNPICIRLGYNENIILADEKNEQNNSLVPGAIFSDDHYGFVLIIDANGSQKEVVYPTQCRIDAVGIEYGVLKVFEEGKKTSWRFSKSGKLEHSTFDEFTDEYRAKFDIPVGMPVKEPVLENPLCVKISKNPTESMILKDDFIQQDYPLYPGIMLGTKHYGFILIFDDNGCHRQICFPTQNRIDAIGIEENEFGDLKVFENGKYHPWTFTHNGKFKEEASYNPSSKKDKEFVKKVYGLDILDAECCYALKMKK